MEFHRHLSRPSIIRILNCVIFFILCSGANSQDVICNSADSATSNTFNTYNVTVPGTDSPILIYDPAKYGPNMRLPVGTTEVTVTAYMTSSLSTPIGNCTFNVTVSLDELPIACPSTNDIEKTDPGESTFQFQINSLDTLPGFDYGSISPNFVQKQLSTNTSGVVNDRFPVGIHAVSLLFFDNYLTKQCNFTLSVVDVEPPTVTCPDDILANTTNVITYTPRGITDNVPDPDTLQSSITFSPVTLSPGSRFPIGNSTVTISVTDGAGNRGNCSFNVNVALKELPITCPAQLDLTVETDPGQSYFTYHDPQFNISYSTTYIPYENITMVRNYGGSVNSPQLAISTQDQYVFLTISDGMLSKTCIEARVQVEDREPPVIVCPDDIYQTNTSIGSNFQPTIFDNSGSSLDIAIIPLPQSIFSVGTTNYTFIVSDRSGNNASCSFNVTVEIVPDPTTVSTEGSTNGMETTVGNDDQRMTNYLPIIIGCSVAAGVILIIIIILGVICSTPSRRRIFGIGPKEPSKIKHVGASRHGVATDSVLLNDHLERSKSNIYESTDIDVEMVDTPNGDGLQEMTETNGTHLNHAYMTDEMMGRSSL
ncbi:hyalin-like [Lytechinus variegatus]|uniref:hyalin-like n=1 Tax=Lytechinus variegatus TaxID=7654 RepID=UPI001BB22AAD|nr:hyalin-like [Lytechinus variegatus]